MVPAEATFAGLSAHPYFADFFYYAVSTAFIAPPGDIIASSRGARTATMIEMLTGFALVTAYLASLFEWRSYASPPKSEQRAVAARRIRGRPL